MNKIFNPFNIILFLICVVLATMVVFIPKIYILGPIFLLALIFLVSRKLIWGIYLMVLFYPFISLQINFDYGINLPVVDLIALVTFIAWIFSLLIKKENRPVKFPGLIYFFGFFLIAALSLLNVTEFGAGQFWLSLKYLLRPIIFFYLMFVILPFNNIKKEEQLKFSFYLLYFLGIAVSLMGVWSLLFIKQTAGVIPRAVPFGIAGLYPLGTNQNLIAETLVSLIPIAWLLIKQASSWIVKYWLSIGLILMALINLLTFSRAGWIVFLLEVFLIIYYEYFHAKKITKKDLWLIFVVGFFVLLILGIMMYNLLTSPIGESSNRNRLELLRISFDTFNRHPLIGQGVGTFQKIVSYDPTYTLEYGLPMESHGFIQKVATETGLLGLFAFLSIILFFLKTSFRIFRAKKDFFSWSLIIVIVGSFVFQLFNTSYYVSKLWLPVGLALTALNVYYPSLFKKHEPKN
ncbi:MAG TPA: O-antigen ligase family protein [bacterium]|nr:O-antigen ligase family protein [bacterium]HPL95651.1 O-antigen ligase family protein [bacterium]